MKPPYGTPEEKAWERRRKGLVGNVTESVRREMEEEDRQAQAAAGRGVGRRNWLGEQRQRQRHTL